MIWAVAHLLVNGTLADLLLFGSFLLWAIVDRISMMNRATRSVPSVPQSKANDIIVVVVGLAVYAAIVFWLHETLLGVKPLI
ncbi:NnrU protein [Nitrosococcus oceani AFC27]|nr:NnrU protein [Nitrosococcus oceani AFC27]